MGRGLGAEINGNGRGRGVQPVTGGLSPEPPASMLQAVLPGPRRPFSASREPLDGKDEGAFSSTTNVRPLSGPCDRSRIFVPFSCRRQCPLGTSLSSGKACNGLLPMAAEDGRETVRHPLTAGLSVLAYFLSPTYRSGQWESPGRSCAWNADQMTHRRPKRLIHEGSTRHA